MAQRGGGGRGLSGTGGEGVGLIDGSTGGGGGWTDQRLDRGRGIWMDRLFDGSTPRLAGRINGDCSTVRA
jgi:hypothetical protein